MESCYTDANTYTNCPGDNTGLDIGTGEGQVQATPDTDGKGYQVVAVSKSGNTFTITKASDGTITRTCSGSGGSCNGTGITW
jgi:type IV pilus assembly protein PilA